jgi:hypothetical protein
VSTSALAQKGPGTTGAVYLSLPVSAQSIAMGEVSTTLTKDPFNWFANPGLQGMKYESGGGVFHSQWMMDTYYDNAFFNYRVARGLTAGVGLTFVSSPEIQGYDINGNETTGLDNNNFEGIVGAGYTPIEGLGIGANIKYFQEKIADWTARGYGVDLGAVYTLPAPDISFGVSLRNLGPDVKFVDHEEELPLTFRAGAGFRVAMLPELLGLFIAADVVRPKHGKGYAAIGAEVSLREIVMVRAGYNGEEYRDDDGFTAGVGLVVLKNFVVDYAWTPYGDLGDFHRISLFYSLKS